jgi:hypothetical protein
LSTAPAACGHRRADGGGGMPLRLIRIPAARGQNRVGNFGLYNKHFVLKAFYLIQFAYTQCWGIRDIFVRIRIRGSVAQITDPDPTTDTTPFFIDFKDTRKLFFSSYIFLITHPQAHYHLS